VGGRPAQVENDPGLAVVGPDTDIFDGGGALRCRAEQNQDTADEKTRNSHREVTTQALVMSRQYTKFVANSKNILFKISRINRFINLLVQ
jgi:arginine/ornithine N-succinyltransferase beta subunit